MPVGIDEFESGDLPEGPSAPEQVVTYLHTNRDAAFTRSEIATAIDEDPNTVGTALTRLKARDLVRHRGRYWAITEDEQRIAAAYDLHDASERLDEADGGIESDHWDAFASDKPHPSERDPSEDERSMEPERGDVVRSTDPFKLGTDRQRPWLVVNNSAHPFADEQHVAVAVSAKEYDDSLRIGEDVWETGGVPRASFGSP